MKKIIFTVLLLCAGQLFAEDCVFDPSSANDSFLAKNENIKYLVWDDKAKEARAIFKDGSLLFVKKWACQHVAMDARLMDFYSEEETGKSDISYQRIIWFASQVLNKSDFKVLESSILKKSFDREDRANGYVLRIPHGTYSEFYVELTDVNDMRTISIVFSFS
ncbi:MAG: hypothetical protein Q7U91_05725 [Sideroxyarcus sp.]|nr:hypothetical protein [Sideroxyarcus sp.]